MKNLLFGECEFRKNIFIRAKKCLKTLRQEENCNWYLKSTAWQCCATWKVPKLGVLCTPLVDLLTPPHHGISRMYRGCQNSFFSNEISWMFYLAVSFLSSNYKKFISNCTRNLRFIHGAYVVNSVIIILQMIIKTILEILSVQWYACYSSEVLCSWG